MPPSVPSRLWNHSRACLIAGGFRDHVIDHLRNDDVYLFLGSGIRLTVKRSSAWARILSRYPQRQRERSLAPMLLRQAGQDQVELAMPRHGMWSDAESDERRKTMFISIRKYHNVRSVDEVKRRVEQEFIPMLKQNPG